MTILLTGGTGKTSSRIAPLLKKHGTPTIIASRSGSAPSGFTGCRFDWLDEATFGNPFKIASDITALYMVAPVAEDLLAAMKPFTDFAISKGIQRFILLTSSAIEMGGPAHGKVHEYLVQKSVDYGVLRPTWFMGMCNLAKTLLNSILLLCLHNPYFLLPLMGWSPIRIPLPSQSFIHESPCTYC